MQRRSHNSNIFWEKVTTEKVLLIVEQCAIEPFCHIKSSKNILHTKLISIPLCGSYPAKIGPG